MIKAVLFDLDGTLLPMDQDEFTRGYFKLLAEKLTPHGYDSEELVRAIWHGTAAMVKNDGSRTNEEAFWEDFADRYGEKALRDKPLFEDFYALDFQQAKNLCGFTPDSAAVVRMIWDMGRRVALATNPIFPSIATESRIRWAGLEPEDFEFFTTYENSGTCKPNLDFYREILRRMNRAPGECLMVGNDVGEDMVAAQLGMKVFLLTDCIINKSSEDISKIPHGNFGALFSFLNEILTV